MGEIFKVHRPDVPAPLTGERLTSAIPGEIEAEHFHRYFYAREFCRGKRVLDVGSGEGYGSFLLAEVASQVVGLEIDKATCEYARRNFARGNLIFVQGDARCIPFEDKSFDIVTSFELIEHFYEHDQFLQDILRVLRARGVLLISSPDRDFYSGLHSRANPFHVRELNRSELKAKLGEYFEHSKIFYHRLVSGSLMLPTAVEPSGAKSLAFERRGEVHFESSVGLPRASYLFTISSNCALPPLPMSVLIDPIAPAQREQVLRETRQKLVASKDERSALETQVNSLTDQVALLEAARASIRQELATLRIKSARDLDTLRSQSGVVLVQLATAAKAQAEADHRAKDLNAQLAAAITARAEADCRAEASAEQLAAVSAQLNQVLNSTSWKIGHPMRRLLDRSTGIRRVLGRTRKLASWIKTLQAPRRLKERQLGGQGVQALQSQARAAVSQESTHAPQGLAQAVVPQESTHQLVDLVLRRYSLAERWYDEVAPEVSVVIINHNNAALTLACLDSIWSVTQGVRYEIILLDNGSSRDDYELLVQAGGLRKLVRFDVNRFFGEGNNLAVERARAKLICFLNNDVTVTEGWLSRLVETLRANPDAGIVGPKFVYPDGRLQEAGALILSNGYSRQIGKGKDPSDPEFNTERLVHYVSAACALVPKDLFLAVGGFDLMWEPAYYEDTDLCFKIREHGKTVRYCPLSQVVHHENSSHREMLGISEVVETNRLKFISRWRNRTAKPQRLMTGRALEPVVRTAPSGAPEVVIFTPYPLVPGGGERYILTIAENLSRHSRVTLTTPHPYSRIRLLNIGRLFGLDLGGVQLSVLNDPSVPVACDLLVALGNEVVPPVPPSKGRSCYMCQFPFPASETYVAERRSWLSGYDCVLVNSNFAKRHFARELRSLDLPAALIEVVAPPVETGRFLSRPRTRQPARIVSVGRFFTGDHCKRQDRLIQAFRQLHGESRDNTEFHLIGALAPGAEHLAYLDHCRKLATGLPISFHLNADREVVDDLLVSSSVYWHGAGLEVDETVSPWALEHFGISIVEAMDAGCIPVAPKRGGPLEIVEHGVTGFLYQDLEELVALTRRVLAEETATRIEDMRPKAAAHAQRFSVAAFNRRCDEVLGPILRPETPTSGPSPRLSPDFSSL
jgi:GT2 family glycosyltransferase/glycosyltransferase involved in cell wall biosynthesis/SAM-dependent methyltransferase